VVKLLAIRLAPSPEARLPWEALERLAEGERSLASLATDLGFADYAHMARTVRRETGAAP